MNIFSCCAKHMASIVSTNDPTIDSTRLAEIEYGLTILLLNICETASILAMAYLLGIVNYMIVAVVSFGSLRIFAGGVHLKGALTCFLVTSTLYFGTVYCAIFIPLPLWLNLILLAIALVCLLLYAPGDTVNRPILSTKRKKAMKTQAVILACTLYTIGLIQSNTIIRNIIVFAIVAESLSVIPTIYKLTKTKGGEYYAQSR